MAKFFIERPIFAWVIAIFIMVLGGVAITQLPIAQYPAVAAPIIQVSVAYPGATAQTLEDSVLAVIEREMNGTNRSGVHGNNQRGQRNRHDLTEL